MALSKDQVARYSRQLILPELGVRGQERLLASSALLVGAGGLGERIVAGLAVNDTDRMLAGAVPAALLALVVQGFFALVERQLVPAPLRAGRQTPTT